MSVWSLTCQQSVFKRHHSGKRFSEFYPQDGDENQLAQIWIEITSLSPYVYTSAETKPETKKVEKKRKLQFGPILGVDPETPPAFPTFLT